jgi:hypothetical protein
MLPNRNETIETEEEEVGEEEDEGEVLVDLQKEVKFNLISNIFLDRVTTAFEDIQCYNISYWFPVACKAESNTFNLHHTYIVDINEIYCF